MWEKAVLKAPFCFVRKDTQNAVNPPTQLARGLHYHKGVFLGDCSVWWKNLALVPTLLKESSWEKLISGALERERQVKWRLKKKKKRKGGQKRWSLGTAPVCHVGNCEQGPCTDASTQWLSHPHSPWAHHLFYPLVTPRIALCICVKCEAQEGDLGPMPFPRFHTRLVLPCAPFILHTVYSWALQTASFVSFSFPCHGDSSY